MANEKFSAKMRRFFNLSSDKVNKHSKGETLFPGKVDKDTHKIKNLVKKDPLMNKYYNLYLQETQDTAASFKNRYDRYNDLDYAYKNSASFSMAVELYSDEAVQADAQNEIISIYAKDKKLETYIVELFKGLNINSNALKAMAYDLTLFSDHFWALSTDSKKGVTDVTLLNPYHVKDRLEFSALEVAKKKNSMFSSTPKAPMIQKILDLMKSQNNDSNDVTALFKKYLFGYVLDEEMVLPPWNILHFRRLTTNSEFAPYGRPLMINAISPFRQYQAAKNLMALARANNFPIRMFSVKVSDKMTEMDKWEAVEEAKDEYKNLGITSSTKENFVIDNEVWMPEDLISLSIEEPRLNLNEIADVELLERELITATGIPEGYIPTANSGGFGDSGAALLQQSKIFARRVFSIQTAMLDGLVSLVKLHLTISGDFPEDSLFELSLNFPVLEETSDKIRLKSDTLSLAQSIISTVGEAVGLDRDEPLPISVVKDILSDVSFLDSADIDKWLKTVEKERETEVVTESLTEKLSIRLSEKQRKHLVRETYFNLKKEKGFNEGVLGSRHYYSSNSALDGFTSQNSSIYKHINSKKKMQG